MLSLLLDFLNNFYKFWANQLFLTFEKILAIPFFRNLLALIFSCLFLYIVNGHKIDFCVAFFLISSWILNIYRKILRNFLCEYLQNFSHEQQLWKQIHILQPRTKDEKYWGWKFLISKYRNKNEKHWGWKSVSCNAVFFYILKLEW